MSLVSIPFTFTVGATIVASQHNSCFSVIYSDYNGNIDNTNISASAGISDTKLGQIATANKVAGSALASLSSVPSGAGVIPIANLASGTPDGTKFIRDDGTLVTPTVIKAFGRIDSSANLSASSGVASASKNATGVFDITLSTALNSGNYVVVATSGRDSSVTLVCGANVTSSTIFRITSINLSNTNTDPVGFINFMVIG